jgi:hypothetical protein
VSAGINAQFQCARESLDRGEYALAIKTAAAASRLAPDAWQTTFNYAGVLIDAGLGTGDRRRVREGMRRLEALCAGASAEAESHIRYNLGNAYLAVGQGQLGRGPLTRPALARAVSEFTQSLVGRESVETQINLSNALIGQGRFIEAIDLLNDVVAASPTHPVAYSSRSQAQELAHHWLNPHRGLLQAALEDAHTALAHAVAPVLREKLQQKVTRLAAKTPRPTAGDHVPPAMSPAAAWIWENGLALNPCRYCARDTPEAFDQYVLEGRLAGGRRRPSVEEVAEIVNAWHRSYSAARWNLLQASGLSSELLNEQVPFMVGFSETEHGLETGLLLTAVTGFHSILGHIAYGLNTYLHLGHQDKSIDLGSMWSRPGWKRPRNMPPMPTKRADLHPRLRLTSARSLSALYNVAWSIETAEGIYRNLRLLRNHAEHHVVVVSSSKRCASQYFHVLDSSDLRRQTIALGRLVKAAMWYAGGVLWWHEGQRAKQAIGRGERVTESRQADIWRA